MSGPRTYRKGARLEPSTELREAVNLFLLDCEARNLSTHTLRYYWQRLTFLVEWLEGQGITAPGAVLPVHLRTYLLLQQAKNLSPDYVHAAARTAKTFFRFCELEELINVSPMHRVRMPRLPKTALPPFTPDDVARLLAACDEARDRAIVYVLLDSGVRGSELCALNVGDVDLTTGRVQVRQGKGRKDRTTFIGAKTRKHVAKYLMTRSTAQSDPLFIGHATGDRLTFYGLQSVVRRIAERAQVYPHGIHRFRRTFAIEALRAGMPIMHLAAMMGHGSLPVLQRYLRLLADDLETAHREHGPVDGLLAKGRGK